MKKILLALIFLFSLNTYSFVNTQPKKRLLECNCNEINWRITFEIDFNNKTIFRVSSVNLNQGEFSKTDKFMTSSTFTPNLSGAVGLVNGGSSHWISVYNFDFVDLTMKLSSIYYYNEYNKKIGRNSFSPDLYKCFWLN